MTLEGLYKSRIQGNVQGGSLRPKSTTRLSILSNSLRLKATPGAELDIRVSYEAWDRSVYLSGYRENYVHHKGGLLSKSNWQCSSKTLISLKHLDVPEVTISVIVKATRSAGLGIHMYQGR